MHIFKQELKINIRVELIYSREYIDTLKTLINELICLNNELFRLALKEQLYLNCL
jgi:hypothetical protein